MSDARKLRVTQYGTVVVAACAVAIILEHPTSHLPVRNFQLSDCVPFFTELTAIALFVERSLEVMLTPWREKDARKMEAEHEAARDQLTVVQQSAIAGNAAAAARVADAKKGADSKRQDVVEYRARTQQVAFLVSLAVGILLSLLGVRAMQFFFNDADVRNLPVIQGRLFQALDVLLTGALISGGADALHQMVTMFTDFANTTSAKMKGT